MQPQKRDNKELVRNFQNGLLTVGELVEPQRIKPNKCIILFFCRMAALWVLRKTSFLYYSANCLYFLPRLKQTQLAGPYEGEAQKLLRVSHQVVVIASK